MRTNIFRVVSIVLSIMLSLQNVSFAGLANAQNVPHTPNGLDKVYIPESYGSIDQRLTIGDQRADQPTVILIKDAHCNYEAQTNISKILETLVRDYKIDLVCVEGAEGLVDTSVFSAYPDQKVREKVADKYVKKGYLCASEALSIAKADSLPFTIYGVENTKLYLENFKEFRNTMNNRQETGRYIDVLINIINNLKNNIYNEKLREFDKKQQDYEENRIGLTDWVKYIRNQKPETSNQRNLNLVLRAVDLEGKIDFKKVEREREVLIKELEKQLTKEDLRMLIEKSLLFKLGKISSLDYYKYLGQYLKSGKYIDLRRYIHLVKIQSGIDSDILFEEIEEAANAIREDLFRNNIESELSRIAENVRILKKLYNLNLTRNELNYYKDNKSNFYPSKMLPFILVQARLNNITVPPELNDEDFLNKVTQFIQPAEYFYQKAIERDSVLVSNLLKKMEKDNKNTAIIVTGGFHSEGILQRLREKGISYVTISPKITKIQEDCPYLDIMMDTTIDIDRVMAELGTGNIPVALLDGNLGDSLWGTVRAAMANDEIRNMTLGELIARYPSAETELRKLYSLAGKSEKTILRDIFTPDFVTKLEDEIVNETNDTEVSFKIEVFETALMVQGKTEVEVDERKSLVDIKRRFHSTELINTPEFKGFLKANGLQEVKPDEMEFEIVDKGLMAIVCRDNKIIVQVSHELLKGLAEVLRNDINITIKNVTDVTGQVSYERPIETSLYNSIIWYMAIHELRGHVRKGVGAIGTQKKESIADQLAGNKYLPINIAAIWWFKKIFIQRAQNKASATPRNDNLGSSIENEYTPEAKTAMVRLIERIDDAFKSREDISIDLATNTELAGLKEFVYVGTKDGTPSTSPTEAGTAEAAGGIGDEAKLARAMGDEVGAFFKGLMELPNYKWNDITGRDVIAGYIEGLILRIFKTKITLPIGKNGISVEDNTVRLFGVCIAMIESDWVKPMIIMDTKAGALIVKGLAMYIGPISRVREAGVGSGVTAESASAMEESPVEAAGGIGDKAEPDRAMGTGEVQIDIMKVASSRELSTIDDLNSRKDLNPREKIVARILFFDERDNPRAPEIQSCIISALRRIYGNENEEQAIERMEPKEVVSAVVSTLLSRMNPEHNGVIDVDYERLLVTTAGMLQAKAEMQWPKKPEIGEVDGERKEEQISQGKSLIRQRLDKFRNLTKDEILEEKFPEEFTSELQLAINDIKKNGPVWLGTMDVVEEILMGIFKKIIPAALQEENPSGEWVLSIYREHIWMRRIYWEKGGVKNAVFTIGRFSHQIDGMNTEQMTKFINDVIKLFVPEIEFTRKSEGIRRIISNGKFEGGIDPSTLFSFAGKKVKITIRGEIIVGTVEHGSTLFYFTYRNSNNEWKSCRVTDIDEATIIEDGDMKTSLPAGRSEGSKPTVSFAKQPGIGLSTEDMEKEVESIIKDSMPADGFQGMAIGDMTVNMHVLDPGKHNEFMFMFNNMFKLAIRVQDPGTKTVDIYVTEKAMDMIKKDNDALTALIEHEVKDRGVDGDASVNGSHRWAWAEVKKNNRDGMIRLLKMVIDNMVIEDVLSLINEYENDFNGKGDGRIASGEWDAFEEEIYEYCKIRIISSWDMKDFTEIFGNREAIKANETAIPGNRRVSFAKMPSPGTTDAGDMEGAVEITSEHFEKAHDAFDKNKTNKKPYDLIVPQVGGRYIMAGLESALADVQNINFSEIVKRLRQSGKFSNGFLDYLSSFKFEGDIDVVPEGTVVSAGVPIVRIMASEVEIALLEGLIRDRVNMAMSRANEGQQNLQFELRPSYGDNIFRVKNKDGKVSRYVKTPRAFRAVRVKKGETVEEILIPYWRKGGRVRKKDEEKEVRERTGRDLTALPEGTIEIQTQVVINPETDALLVIDAQPTFMPGGGLAVTDGDKIIPNIRGLTRLFSKQNRFATRDWHPRGHISLASSYIGLPAMTVLTYDMVKDWTESERHINPEAKFTLNELKEYLRKVGFQVLWPDHGIQDTDESNVHSDIPESEFGYVLDKGTDPKCDSYSGFFDNLGRPTGLVEELRKQGFRRVFVVGLAKDYCVGWTAEGASKEGFEVVVIDDATKPVGFPAGSVENMHNSFMEKGISLVAETASLVSPEVSADEVIVEIRPVDVSEHFSHPTSSDTAASTAESTETMKVGKASVEIDEMIDISQDEITVVEREMARIQGILAEYFGNGIEVLSEGSTARNTFLPEKIAGKPDLDFTAIIPQARKGEFRNEEGHILPNVAEALQNMLRDKGIVIEDMFFNKKKISGKTSNGFAFDISMHSDKTDIYAKSPAATEIKNNPELQREVRKLKLFLLYNGVYGGERHGLIGKIVELLISKYRTMDKALEEIRHVKLPQELGEKLAGMFPNEAKDLDDMEIDKQIWERFMEVTADYLRDRAFRTTPITVEEIAEKMGRGMGTVHITEPVDIIGEPLKCFEKAHKIMGDIAGYFKGIRNKGYSVELEEYEVFLRGEKIQIVYRLNKAVTIELVKVGPSINNTEAVVKFLENNGVNPQDLKEEKVIEIGNKSVTVYKGRVKITSRLDKPIDHIKEVEEEFRAKWEAFKNKQKPTASGGMAFRHNLSNQKAGEIIKSAKGHEDIEGLGEIKSKLSPEEWGNFERVCKLAGYTLTDNNVKLIIVDTDNEDFEVPYGNVRRTGGEAIRVFVKKGLLGTKDIGFTLAHEFLEGCRLRELIQARVTEGEDLVQTSLRLENSGEMGELEDEAHEWTETQISLIKMMYPPEGKRSGVMADLKGDVLEIMIMERIRELKNLTVLLQKERLKKDEGLVNEYGEARSVYIKRFKEFCSIFMGPEDEFLNNFNEDCLLIFFDEDIPDSEGGVFKGIPQPDIIIAKVEKRGDEYIATLIPCDLKLHLWSETTDEPVVKMRQIDPDLSELGKRLKDQKSVFHKLIRDYLTGSGLLPADAKEVKVNTAKGRVITVDAPVPSPSKNPWVSSDKKPFSLSDLLVIRSEFLISGLKTLFMDAFKEYLALFNKSPSEVERIAEGIFNGDNSILSEYIEEEKRDYTTKKIFRGPVARLVELAIIWTSIGDDKITTKVPDINDLAGVIKEIKTLLNTLNEEERTAVTKTHESLRSFLIGRFIEAKRGKPKDELGIDRDLLTIVCEGKDPSLVEPKQKAKVRELKALLYPHIESMLEDIKSGKVTFEEARANIIAKAEKIFKEVPLFGSGEEEIREGGILISRERRIMPPPASESTLGTRELRRKFVSERIAEGLAEKIAETIGNGGVVSVSIHAGRDSEVREKWHMLGETKFPRPEGEAGGAKKHSEKKFYWGKDENGNLFITVTNIFGDDNLHKTTQFFAELGCLHMAIYDYHIDYVAEVKRALEKARDDGVPLDTVAIGPPESVLGDNIDMRVLGFEMGRDLLERFKECRDVESLKTKIKDALKEKLKGNNVPKEFNKLLKEKNMLEGFSGLDIEGKADLILELGFKYVKWGEIFKMIKSPELAGPNFRDANWALLQQTGYFIAQLEHFGIDGIFGFTQRIKAIKKQYQKVKLTKGGDESVYAVSVNTVPDLAGGLRRMVTIGISYGDLTKYVASALKEMGVKKVIFNGNAGYDVSRRSEYERKERLGIKEGDIIVPTTMRDKKGKVITGVHLTALERIVASLEAQGRSYRIVSALGEGSILRDSDDSNAVTLIMSHHGNVDSLLDETDAYMAKLGRKGIRSIEVEAGELAEVFKGTGIEFIPVIYISDFPGDPNASFAKGGVAAPSKPGAIRAKNIFTDLVLQEWYRQTGLEYTEEMLLNEFKGLVEAVLPYFVDREKAIDETSISDEGFRNLIEEIRKSDYFDWKVLRLLMDYLKDNSKSEKVRDLIKGNERYYIFRFPAMILDNQELKNLLRTAMEKVLIDGSTGEKILAVRFVTSFYDIESLGLLLANINHRSLSVRREIIKSIGILGRHLGYSETAIEALINNLSDKDKLIRWYAAFHLRDFKNDRIMGIMSGFMAGEDRDKWILASAMMSGEKFKFLRNIVIEGLGSRDEYIRNIAVALLGKFGDVKDIETLEPCLKDNSIAVAEAALESIRLIGGNRSLEIIKAVADNKDNRLQQQAKRILARTERKEIKMISLTEEQRVLRDKIIAFLLGVGIGDAIGMPVEFLPYEEIANLPDAGRKYITNERRNRQVLRMGMTGDDTQTMTALAESLVRIGIFDPIEASRSLGSIAEAFDSGRQDDRGYSFSMMDILRLLSIGINWRLTGDPKKTGDGAAMRAEPIGVIHMGDTEALRKAAGDQAMITHASSEARASSLAISFMISKLLALKGEEEIDSASLLSEVVSFVEPASKEFADRLRSLEGCLNEDIATVIKRIGADLKEGGSKAIAAVPAAIYIFLRYPRDFRSAVHSAVTLCGDSDTVASMVGAMVGAFCGTSVIPNELIDGLENSKTLINLGERIFGIIYGRTAEKETKEEETTVSAKTEANTSEPAVAQESVINGRFIEKPIIEPKEIKKAVNIVLGEYTGKSPELGKKRGLVTQLVSRYLEGKLSYEALEMGINKLKEGINEEDFNKVVSGGVSEESGALGRINKNYPVGAGATVPSEQPSVLAKPTPSSTEITPKKGEGAETPSMKDANLLALEIDVNEESINAILDSVGKGLGEDPDVSGMVTNEGTRTINVRTNLVQQRKSGKLHLTILTTVEANKVLAKEENAQAVYELLESIKNIPIEVETIGKLRSDNKTFFSKLLSHVKGLVKKTDGELPEDFAKRQSDRQNEFTRVFLDYLDGKVDIGEIYKFVIDKNMRETVSKMKKEDVLGNGDRLAVFLLLRDTSELIKKIMEFRAKVGLPNDSYNPHITIGIMGNDVFETQMILPERFAKTGNPELTRKFAGQLKAINDLHAKGTLYFTSQKTGTGKIVITPPVSLFQAYIKKGTPGYSDTDPLEDFLKDKGLPTEAVLKTGSDGKLEETEIRELVKNIISELRKEGVTGEVDIEIIKGIILNAFTMREGGKSTNTDIKFVEKSRSLFGDHKENHIAFINIAALAELMKSVKDKDKLSIYLGINLAIGLSHEILGHESGNDDEKGLTQEDVRLTLELLKENNLSLEKYIELLVTILDDKYVEGEVNYLQELITNLRYVTEVKTMANILKSGRRMVLVDSDAEKYRDGLRENGAQVDVGVNLFNYDHHRENLGKTATQVCVEAIKEGKSVFVDKDTVVFVDHLDTDSILSSYVIKHGRELSIEQLDFLIEVSRSGDYFEGELESDAVKLDLIIDNMIGWGYWNKPGEIIKKIAEIDRVIEDVLKDRANIEKYKDKYEDAVAALKKCKERVDNAKKEDGIEVAGDIVIVYKAFGANKSFNPRGGYASRRKPKIIIFIEKDGKIAGLGRHPSCPEIDLGKFFSHSKITGKLQGREIGGGRRGNVSEEDMPAYVDSLPSTKEVIDILMGLYREKGLRADMLTEEERKIIKTGNLTRKDDSKVLLCGYLAEIQFHEFFDRGPTTEKKELASRIRQDCIQGKKVLVVPGYGTNSFLFNLLGAKETYSVDVDEVSQAWLKAVRLYWNYKGGREASIGEIMMVTGTVMTDTNRDVYERVHRTVSKGQYFEYESTLVEMIQEAVEKDEAPCSLEGDINFVCAALGEDSFESVLDGKEGFDFIYISFLLGIENGIVDEESIKKAINQLCRVAKPGAKILIYPIAMSFRHVKPGEEDVRKRFLELESGSKEVSKLYDLIMANNRIREVCRFGLGWREMAIVLEVVAPPSPTAEAGGALKAGGAEGRGHIKARTEKPDIYPDRFSVPDEYVRWETEFPGYTPPYCVAPDVIANDRTKNPEGWADPEGPVPAGITSYEGKVHFDDQGRPLNIRGRTGIQGRGLLGKWGPNFAADPIVTRVNSETGEIEMLAIQRKNGQWAIPGGMVDKGEEISSTLRRELREETGVDIDMSEGAEIYRGYVDDPRNTDNAWMETIAKHRHLTPEIADKMQLKAGSDARAVRWMPLTEQNLDNLYANHSVFVRMALTKVLELMKTESAGAMAAEAAEKIAGIVKEQLGKDVDVDVKKIKEVLSGPKQKITLLDILQHVKGALTVEQLLDLGDRISKLDSIRNLLGANALQEGGQLVLSILQTIVEALGEKVKDTETIEAAFRRALGNMGVVDAESDSIFNLIYNELNRALSIGEPLDKGVEEIAKAVGISEEALLRAYVEDYLKKTNGEEIAKIIGNLNRDRRVNPVAQTLLINLLVNTVFGKEVDTRIAGMVRSKTALLESIAKIRSVVEGQAEEKLDSPVFDALMRIRFYKELKTKSIVEIKNSELGKDKEVQRVVRNTDFADFSVAVIDMKDKAQEQVNRFSETSVIEKNLQRLAGVVTDGDTTPRVISVPIDNVFPELDELIEQIAQGETKVDLAYFAGLLAFFNLLESKGNKNVKVALQTKNLNKSISGITGINTKGQLIEAILRLAGLDEKVFVTNEIEKAGEIGVAQEQIIGKSGLEGLKEENIAIFASKGLSEDLGQDSSFESIKQAIANNRIKVFGIESGSQLPAILLLGYKASSVNVFESNKEGARVLSNAMRDILKQLRMGDKDIADIVAKGVHFIKVKLIRITETLQEFRMRHIVVDIAA